MEKGEKEEKDMGSQKKLQQSKINKNEEYQGKGKLIESEIYITQ